MKKITKVEFIKENKEYINKVFNEIMVFIENSEDIILRSDEESFRLDIINYLYNIYLNGKY